MMHQLISNKNRNNGRRRWHLPLALVWAIFCSGIYSGFGAEVYKTVSNISYYPADSAELHDAYASARCKLDLYYPHEVDGFTTIVWFHGGGLTGGNKSIPDRLKEKGLAVVAVNYRLYPKIKSPVYVEDAAAAVAWAFKNIKQFGGDPGKIVVSGHSAGGYLTSMVGLDTRYLGKHGIHPNSLLGLVPFSGHTITHFTVRKERGIKGEQPIIDDMAPLYHVRKDAPPLVLITGDRNLEMLGRYEENAYMMRMMKVVGHPQTSLYELQGYNQGGMAQPAHPILIRYARKWSSPEKEKSSNP